MCFGADSFQDLKQQKFTIEAEPTELVRPSAPSEQLAPTDIR
jgi:hypothetical protein